MSGMILSQGCHRLYLDTCTITRHIMVKGHEHMGHLSVEVTA